MITSGKAAARSALKREIAVNNALLKLSNYINKDNMLGVRSIITHKLTGSLYKSYKTVVDSRNGGFSQHQWSFCPTMNGTVRVDSSGQYLTYSTITDMDKYVLMSLGYHIHRVSGGLWRVFGSCKTFAKQFKDRSKRGMHIRLSDFDTKLATTTPNATVTEFDAAYWIKGIKESSMRINELQVKINELQQELDHELNNKDALVTMTEDHIRSL